MPQLITQKDLREVQKLPFCYICGQPFSPGEGRNLDHLPPSSLFLKQDRDPPLKLPTHQTCNANWSNMDELLGILVGFVHGRPVGHRQRLLRAEAVTVAGRMATHVMGLDFDRFLHRCLRGFHAALYGQWVPEDTENAIHPPIHGVAVTRATGQPADELQALLAEDKGLPQQEVWTAILKKNRFINNIDRVITRNNRCVYECVWTVRYGFVFGLKIYDWHRSGERFGYPNRGCVGMYKPKVGRPVLATRETELVFSFPNKDKLDPFRD